MNKSVEVPELRAKANAGDANAQFDLGLAYFHGRGVPQDFEKAEDLYRLAADQGQVDAQSKLESLLDDLAEARFLEAAAQLLEPAKQGDVDAQIAFLNLSDAPYNLRHSDALEVKGWLRKAADQGDVDAQIYLGEEGWPQDFEQSAKWYRLAAGQLDDHRSRAPQNRTRSPRVATCVSRKF